MSSPNTSPTRFGLVSLGLKLGGSTTFLCNLAGELIRRGIAAEVLSFSQEHPMRSDFERVGIPVLLQDERRLIFEDRLRVVLNRLRQFEPTVVVANLSAESFEVLRYMPAGVFRAGIAHSDDAKVYAMIYQYAAHLDFLALVSREIERKVAQMSAFSSVKFGYLPLGVPMPPERGHSCPQQAKKAGAPLRILYLGRLDREQKRVHLFPEIFNALKKSGIPFHWTIAGEGAERPALEMAIKSSTPNQTVSFPGQIAYVDVPRVLEDHDVFLLASDYEGLPLGLLEAMARGLVPVISDLPSGIRELVDDATGKRVSPENIAGYAEAIVWLHGHREDMAKMSEVARQKVSGQFSVEAMADRWLAILPAAPNREIRWPDDWNILPMLGPRRWRFSGPARVLRRAVLKLRASA
jgi:glycosyltransferase involved in cell wall biosynthesis